MATSTAARNDGKGTVIAGIDLRVVENTRRELAELTERDERVLKVDEIIARQVRPIPPEAASVRVHEPGGTIEVFERRVRRVIALGDLGLNDLIERGQ